MIDSPTGIGPYSIDIIVVQRDITLSVPQIGLSIHVGMAADRLPSLGGPLSTCYVYVYVCVCVYVHVYVHVYAMVLTTILLATIPRTDLTEPERKA